MKWLAIRAFEAWAVAALLRSPAFHRGVGHVAKTVSRIRHGTPVEEMGGTKLEKPENARFLKHFKEELREQMGWKGGNQNGNKQ